MSKPPALLSDSALIQVVCIKNFSHYTEGDIFQAEAKHVRTWLKSGCVRLAEDEDIRKLEEKTMQEAEQLQQQHKEEVNKVLPILTNPDFIQLIQNELDKKIVGEVEARHTLILFAFGCFVLNQSRSSFNLAINDESGVGKDYVTSKTLDIFPIHRTIKRVRISETALTYWKKDEPEWNWDGKILFLSDVPNNVLNSDVMKVFLSDGGESTITINHEAVDIVVNGKPVIFLTYAKPSQKLEMGRRIPNINLTATSSQTKAILKRQGELAAKGIQPEYDPLIKQALSSLGVVKVVIPFADVLYKHFPIENVTIRTHFPRFLDLIRASAAGHQFQRKKEKDSILAEPQDYDYARRALIYMTSNPLMVSLSKTQKEILDALKAKFPDQWVGVTDMVGEMPFISESGLRKQLDKDVMLLFLEKKYQQHEDSMGRRTKPEEVFRVKVMGSLVIPTWEDIQKSKESKEGEESKESKESVESRDKPSNPIPRLSLLNSLSTPNLPYTQLLEYIKSSGTVGRSQAEIDSLGLGSELIGRMMAEAVNKGQVYELKERFYYA